MDRKAAVNQLKTLIDEGNDVLATSFTRSGSLGGPWVKSELYLPWQAKASMVLHEVLPEHQQTLLRKLEEKKTNHTSIAVEWQGQLQDALDAIEQGVIELEDANEESCDIVIERILDRFPAL